MKNLLLLLIFPSFLLLFHQETFSQSSQIKPSSTLNGKEFLLDYFTKSSENLLQKTKGLTTAQLQFKPSEEQWSVSQCLEHIIETEKMLFSMTKDLLDKPANPERKEEVKNTDQEVIDGMVSRANKVKAPAELEPVGRYKSSETAIMDLQEQRKQIFDFIESIPTENLRNHIADSPYGPFNAYHSLLFIPAHTARHTAQIEEIMSSPDFPKD